MCIICRARKKQKNLHRFQISDGKVVKYSKLGRSNYICKKCIGIDEKKLLRIFNGKFKLQIEFGDYFSTKVRVPQGDRLV